MLLSSKPYNDPVLKRLCEANIFRDLNVRVGLSEGNVKCRIAVSRIVCLKVFDDAFLIADQDRLALCEAIAVIKIHAEGSFFVPSYLL